MKIETRLNEDMQTIIPSYFVQEYDLEEGDVVEWNYEDGKLCIVFRKVGQ